MISFTNLIEKKKKSQAEPKHQTTATSAPIKGANQDQSGVGVSHDSADYTISDGFIAGVSGDRAPQVTQKPSAHGRTLNAPASAASLQSAASKRTQMIDKQDQKKDEQQVKDRKMEINTRLQNQQKDAAKTAIAPKAAPPAAAPAAPKPPKAKPVQESKTYMTFADFIKVSEDNITEARGRPKKNPTEEDPGSEHPIMQARKVISTRGQHVFTHVSGEKHQMDPKTAHKILAHHDNLKTPAEKQAYATRIHRSKASMADALAGKAEVVKPKVTLAGKYRGSDSK